MSKEIIEQNIDRIKQSADKWSEPIKISSLSSYELMGIKLIPKGLKIRFGNLKTDEPSFIADLIPDPASPIGYRLYPSPDSEGHKHYFTLFPVAPSVIEEHEMISYMIRYEANPNLPGVAKIITVEQFVKNWPNRFKVKGPFEGRLEAERLLQFLTDTRDYIPQAILLNPTLERVLTGRDPKTGRPPTDEDFKKMFVVPYIPKVSPPDSDILN